MLWKMDQTRHLFEKIKDDNRADSHVHIFTAMDADSVCSCKILEVSWRRCGPVAGLPTPSFQSAL